MWFRWRTEVTGGSPVGIDRRDAAQSIRTGIDIHATYAAGVLAVWTHATIAAHLNGGDGAVVLRTDLVILHCRPAAVYAKPIVAP